MTFQINFPNRRAVASKGAPVAIEFPDGKGVSAIIADVDIEPGGGSFVIICTQDGNVDECTCPPNGIDALTLANADLIRERDELRSRATNADDEIHHLRANLDQLMQQLDGEQAKAERWERQATRWEGMYRTQFEMSDATIGEVQKAAREHGMKVDFSVVGQDDTQGTSDCESLTPLSIKDGPQQLVINLYLTGDH